MQVRLKVAVLGFRGENESKVLGGPEKGRFSFMNIFDYSSVLELLDV